VPAKHTAQLDSVVAADADNVVPAGQLKQLDCPELVWYVPAAQGWHTEAPVSENVPAPQATQLDDVDADGDADAVPAPQATQLDTCNAPSDVAYFPAIQPVQLDAPVPTW